jgi:hypothetical protein
MVPAWQVLCARAVAHLLSNALNVSGAFMGGTSVIFCRVLLDAKERFDFEMRGLALSGRDRWFQRGRFFAPAPWQIF